MSRRERPAAARMRVSARERVDHRDMAGPTVGGHGQPDRPRADVRAKHSVAVHREH
jgi:hypothetical protein